MTTLFAICFLVGLWISAVSLFSSALHVHHGGAHFHGQGHGHGHGHSSLLKNSHDFFGSIFNLAAITMFLTCFGGIGLLLGRTTHLAALIVAVLAGGAGVAGAAMLVRILQAMRPRELEPIQLVGTVGKLTIPIREGGTGEVVYTVDGKRRCSGARSDDTKRPIPRGTEVVITKHDKGIAYVCEFDRMIAQ